MPELPDVEAYCAAIQCRVAQQVLNGLDVINPFFLRSVEPPLEALVGRRIGAMTRLGKRIVFEFLPPEPRGESYFAIVHLMVAGRLKWAKADAKIPAKLGLAAFRFDVGSLIVTEAGSKRRASLHLAEGKIALAAHDPGGQEPLAVSLDQFSAELLSENRTLKRILTDPRRFAGIGNAFSDEILHQAKLSPIMRTHSLVPEQIQQLYLATQKVLSEWTARLSQRYVAKFPGSGEVTAFRSEFAVHGKFGEVCPACGGSVQRIRYAENETNYCPVCQTGGRVLADRSLSRLLKDDWPRSISEME